MEKFLTWIGAPHINKGGLGKNLRKKPHTFCIRIGPIAQFYLNLTHNPLYTFVEAIITVKTQLWNTRFWNTFATDRIFYYKNSILE